MTDDPELQDRVDRLHALISLFALDTRRPIESSGSFEDWSVFAPATVMRCAYVCESIISLAQRPVDAAVLVRTLCENVITFAWIAADPPARMPVFVAHEHSSRLAALNDLGGLDSEPPNAAQIRADSEAYLAGASQRRMPNLPLRCKSADQHWEHRLPHVGLGAIGGFKGAYVICFRNYSAFTHPAISGLNPFVFERPDGLRVGRPSSENVGAPVGYSAILLGTLGFITSATLGWPDVGAIEDIFDRYPTPSNTPSNTPGSGGFSGVQQ